MSKAVEIRGNRLIAVVKSVVPGAGFVKPDPKSSGRKVFFVWRRTDFVISSRLHVQECGFGHEQPFGVAETDETKELTAQFKHHCGA